MKNQKISFERKNYVVLIGDNGSGKTTILEAITKEKNFIADTICECKINVEPKDFIALSKQNPF